MNRSRRQILKVGCAAFAAARRSWAAEPVLGVVLPVKGDVPAEAITMYPKGVKFVAEGLSDRTLVGTVETYEALQDRLLPAARAVAEQGAGAVLVLGTSVTFYRGAAYHQSLIDSIRKATGLPTTTMSGAIVEGLKAVGGRRLAVATGYTNEVNERFRVFLDESGFQVVALRGLGRLTPSNLTRDELGAFVAGTFEAAPKADAVVMAFASSRTLELIASLEGRSKVPVISARPHAFWAGVRLLGLQGTLAGFGTLLSRS